MTEKSKDDQNADMANEVMRAANNANPVEIFFKDGRGSIRGIIGIIPKEDPLDRFEVETDKGNIINLETGDVREIKSNIPKNVWIKE
jgi:hypothetical protein